MKSLRSTTRTTKTFFVHPLAVVESNNIGARTRVWPFTHVMKQVRVGSDCNIGEHVFVENGAVLGDNVTVKNGVSIWAGVTIEDNVFLGPNCVFTNDRNPRAYVKKPVEELTPTRIKSNATIGANATVLCGVTIGKYAFIGAGAVVLRSVPDFGLAVGNPGNQIGWMCICAKRLPLPAVADAGARCACTCCNRSYVKTPTGLCYVQSERAKDEHSC